MNSEPFHVKGALLTALEKQKGEYISGAGLSQLLGCSRNAVSKAAARLRSEGYPIEAVPNRGYRLLPTSDLLSEEALRLLLPDPALAIRVLSSVSSTNEWIKLHPELKGPALVVSEEQTAGRTHTDGGFYSPRGDGLYLSLLLDPTVFPEGDSISRVVSQVVAQAALSSVQYLYSISLQQEEPASLLDPVTHRKVGGILTEATLDIETGKLSRCIVGLGILTKTPEAGWDREGLISLQEINGRDYSNASLSAFPSRNELAADFVRRLLSFPTKQIRLSLSQ